jgi:nucleotide-binding universal stress UspA family protein
MKVFRRLHATGVETQAAGATGPLLADVTGARPGDRDTSSILVAVGADTQNWDALDWAAAEAAARSCPLRIVHAFKWDPVLLAGPWAVPVDSCDHTAAETAASILLRARSRAAEVAPSVRMTTHAREGRTASAILREGSQDALIVLGRSRRSGGSRLLNRSIGRRVARRANCPVAVIQLAPEALRRAAVGRVVVVLDGMNDPGPILSFALRAADKRGTVITVLRTWEPLRRSSRFAIDSDTVGAHCSDFPHIQVRQLSVRSPTCLMTELEGVALLVLSSAKGRNSGMSLGSAGRLAMQSARCPVALVGSSPTRRSLGSRGGASCAPGGGQPSVDE